MCICQVHLEKKIIFLTQSHSCDTSDSCPELTCNDNFRSNFLFLFFWWIKYNGNQIKSHMRSTTALRMSVIYVHTRTHHVQTQRDTKQICEDIHMHMPGLCTYAHAWLVALFWILRIVVSKTQNTCAGRHILHTCLCLISQPKALFWTLRMHTCIHTYTNICKCIPVYA
jgi:hypothetical protein